MFSSMVSAMIYSYLAVVIDPFRVSFICLAAKAYGMLTTKYTKGAQSLGLKRYRTECLDVRFFDL